MTDEQQVVERCFDDETVGENCDDCIAHPSNSPADFECCFGTRHEWHDSTCRQCEYENRCSRLSHGVTPSKRRVLVRSRSKPSPSYGVQGHREETIKPLLPDIVEAPSNRTSAPQRQEEPEEPFVKVLLRVMGWGAVEGGLQMALSHFQKNRPK